MIRVTLFLLLYMLVSFVSMGQVTTEKPHRYQFLMSYGPSYTTLPPYTLISSFDSQIESFNVSARHGSILHFDILRRFAKNRFWGFSFSRQQHAAEIYETTNSSIKFTNYRFVSIKNYYQLFIGHTFGKYFDMSVGVGMFATRQPKITYIGDGMYELYTTDGVDDMFFSINMGYMYPLDKYVQVGAKARYYSGYKLELFNFDALTVQPSIQISF